MPGQKKQSLEKDEIWQMQASVRNRYFTNKVFEK